MTPSDENRGRQRGATILEIMLSMAIVLVGMLALVRVLSVASKGSQSSQRHTQALARGQQILEAMRTAPPSVLDCLSITDASSWSSCEAQCLQWLATAAGQTAVPSAQSCVFSTLSINQQDRDGTQQSYAVLGGRGAQDLSSWVLNNSPNHSVYDAQVTIGWKDDGSASIVDGCAPLQHCVTLRTSMYRDPL